MDKTFTSKISDYTSFFFFALVLFLPSCTTHVEQETEEATTTTNFAPEKASLITVAAIERTADEVYFDLIAETDNCLGEDLWLGGKLQSTDKVVLSNSGAFSKTKEYVVTELTATGLNSNNTYQVNNNNNLIRAKYDNKSTIYLQLSDGHMQLKPYPSAAPIVVAYKTVPENGYYEGSLGQWRCN
ncbi:hypothetical protein ABID22_001107 [Pontibacter aydingkolensis]|uniref:Lipoprotein n=1 Tax=Pontibacter aydingkolensis TaxID=1911536 RepID=A0ABS7CT40_9BACT|nr:hypothetical protein [Pontibacter aydingkolensis]MBW7467017.1 hypothetical protein [Pontibacter aydingkolensis]